MVARKNEAVREVEEKPSWKIQHPEWEWDRKCTLCGCHTMMENPEVYDIEVYECQNSKCRAQFTIKTFYDLKTGKFLREEFKGMTMGAIHG
jgi:hypothetical protein